MLSTETNKPLSDWLVVKLNSIEFFTRKKRGKKRDRKLFFLFLGPKSALDFLNLWHFDEENCEKKWSKIEEKNVE